ncbi:MAG TPA: CvpA family protein [Pseudomonadales bacterium]|nr:CvpA family protein [Pseudomonadales bacterium]
MNGIDYAIIAVLAISSVASLVRGFVREAISLATWAAALIISFNFDDRLASLLQPYITVPVGRQMAAFTLLFAGTLLVGALVGSFARKLLAATGMSLLDRLLGMAFGLARAVLIIVLIISMGRGAAEVFPNALTQSIMPEAIQKSLLIDHFVMLENWMRTEGKPYVDNVKSAAEPVKKELEAAASKVNK